MGIKFKREYEEISNELAEAIYNIQDFYTFFDMNSIEYNELSEDERKECAKTLADDLFYGLFIESIIDIGIGSAEYNKENFTITISDGKGYKKIINLI